MNLLDDHAPLRSPLRWTVTALLLVNALIHLVLTPSHLEEAPYIGVGFLLLSIACLALAGGLVLWDVPLVWAASTAVNALGLIAFIASRTVGLPQIGDDVGNWGEPLGVLTMVVEAAGIGLGALVLHRAGDRTSLHSPVRHPGVLDTNRV